MYAVPPDLNDLKWDNHFDNYCSWNVSIVSKYRMTSNCLQNFRESRNTWKGEFIVSHNCPQFGSFHTKKHILWPSLFSSSALCAWWTVICLEGRLDCHRGNYFFQILNGIKIHESIKRMAHAVSKGLSCLSAEVVLKKSPPDLCIPLKCALCFNWN